MMYSDMMGTPFDKNETDLIKKLNAEK